MKWPPGVLTGPGRYGYSWNKVVSGSESVWWVSEGGTLLVDGIMTDSDDAFKGAVVNLTGEHVRMSIPKTMISLSDQILEDNLSTALPVLLAEDHRPLSLEWLWQLGYSHPQLRTSFWLVSLKRR